MNKKIVSLVSFFALLAVLAFTPAAFAQTATYNTTLTAAITATTNQIPLASMTNLVASSQVVTEVLFCDGEAMYVRSINTTTLYATVGPRGYNGTRATTHLSGAICWFGGAGNAGPFVTNDPRPGSACTATQYPFLPLINFSNSTIFGCASGRWTSWNVLNGQSAGRTVSASLAYTALLSDYIIAYTSLTAARTVTLPTPNIGMLNKFYIIKDESGNGTLSIWLTGVVDGATTNTTVCANAAYGACRLYNNGSAWFKW